jgi:hypothetical protein
MLLKSCWEFRVSASKEGVCGRTRQTDCITPALVSDARSRAGYYDLPQLTKQVSEIRARVAAAGG